VKPVSFASIGECMIELSGRDSDLWHMGFAGDTFNTAWYARAISPQESAVAYVTALGDDPFSARMRNFIGNAGIATDRIRTIPGRRPGLYAITLSGAERTFTYWRADSAARQLADEEDWLGEALNGAELLYFSGITLAILAASARARLIRLLVQRREDGCRIAFDPNFRPALWLDLGEARAAMETAYRTADVVLPTFDDEAKLFGDNSPEATLKRVAAFGVSEIVVKNGDNPSLLAANGEQAEIPAVKPKRVVDTTGAGDSFGGAYLAARLIGMDPARAARLGHHVAARVIGVKGALARIDRDDVLRGAEIKRGA
jgi:2-dehydro-3-deoxygluconokinase